MEGTSTIRADLDQIIEEATNLATRANGASMYPANELIVIAHMISELARIIKEGRRSP